MVTKDFDELQQVLVKHQSAKEIDKQAVNYALELLKKIEQEFKKLKEKSG
jgi:hypothetical protein